MDYSAVSQAAKRFEQKSKAWVNLTEKPDLVWIVKEIFSIQLHSKSGFIFTITLIRVYIIKHQNMKDLLQQVYHNIVLGGGAFIESSISLHFLWLRLASFLWGKIIGTDTYFFKIIAF